MENSVNNQKTFGEKADAYLAAFYTTVGAVSTPQKITALLLKLGEESGQSNYYAFGGNLTEEMKLGCLEYEFLEKEDQITLVLA